MRRNNLVARRTVRNTKQSLVESIMAKVAPIVKKALNESLNANDDIDYIYDAICDFDNDITKDDIHQVSGDLYDIEDCSAYIFQTEKEAFDYCLDEIGPDYCECAMRDEDWVSYLIKGGVNPSLAKRIIRNGDWKEVTRIILDSEGPEFFLSSYSGQSWYLDNGKILYW